MEACESSLSLLYTYMHLAMRAWCSSCLVSESSLVPLYGRCELYMLYNAVVVDFAPVLYISVVWSMTPSTWLYIMLDTSPFTQVFVYSTFTNWEIHGCTIFCTQRINDGGHNVGIFVWDFKVIHMPRKCALILVKNIIHNAYIIGIDYEAKVFH